MKTPGNKCLIIDDTPLDLYVMEYIIRLSGLSDDIIAFGSAIDALKYMKAAQKKAIEFPTYIFLDINMPVFNGFKFLDEYKLFADSLTQQSSIIVVTAADSGNTYETALAHPLVKKVIVKPVTCAVVNELFNSPTITHCLHKTEIILQ